MTPAQALASRQHGARSAFVQRCLQLLLGLALPLWLLGCAQPQPLSNGAQNVWSGRISLQVEGQASQSFSAVFELRGDPTSGELVLNSPLGSRIAQLQWQDGHAQLATAQETRSSHALDTLLKDVTGTQIPVAALFQWLQGVQSTTPGWRADLSRLEEGRLIAHRDNPAPPATLRIALTR